MTIHSIKPSVALNQIVEDLTARMRADMRNTIEQHLGYDETVEAFLDALVSDGMFPVEHLLVENDSLTTELAKALTAARGRMP